MNQEKKLVLRNKTEVDLEYHTLESAIEELQRLANWYGKDAKLVMVYDYDDKECLFVQVEELETDIEFNKRVEEENRYKKIKEENELKEFERLAKKYGK